MPESQNTYLTLTRNSRQRTKPFQVYQWLGGVKRIKPDFKLPALESSGSPWDFLSYTDLSGKNVNLTGADLSGANLQQTDFSKARLVGSIFSEANLEGANLTGVDLTGVKLQKANLTRANLKDTTGIDLESLKKANAILCKTTLPDGTIESSGCTDRKP